MNLFLCNRNIKTPEIWGEITGKVPVIDFYGVHKNSKNFDHHKQSGLVRKISFFYKCLIDFHTEMSAALFDMT